MCLIGKNNYVTVDLLSGNQTNLYIYLDEYHHSIFYSIFRKSKYYFLMIEKHDYRYKKK